MRANSAWLKPLAYGGLNIASASGIVFANKLVLSTYGFGFPATLTWLHTLATLGGVRCAAAAGLFTNKRLGQRKVFPLAASYVGYVVLCNVSLKLNSVGFYQVMKIAVAPTVMALELLLHGTVPQPRIAAAVFVVCAGVALATVGDTTTTGRGAAVGVAATIVTALYQIWVGSKQRELGASSLQLLHAYTPQATVMLGVLAPLLEPLGLLGPQSGTVLGYHFSAGATAAIVLSALLGLLVTLSTFLVIGATSSLTYNVVGHVKTLIILAGGVVLFHETMAPKKAAGIAVAMAGIVWYTQLKLTASYGGKGAPPPKSSSGGSDGEGAGPVLPTTATGGLLGANNTKAGGSGGIVYGGGPELWPGAGRGGGAAAAAAAAAYYRPGASVFMPTLQGIVHRTHH